jgi:hypothetical protein
MKNILFTSSDIKALVLRNKKKLFSVFFLSFCLMLGYLAIKKPIYKSEALYQIVESGQKEKSLLDKMLANASDEQNAPISLFQSKKILVPVIQSLGLQVSVVENTLTDECLQNFRKNILAEFTTRPLEKKGFVFKDVIFLKRIKESFFLRVIGTKKYEILSTEKKLLASGKIGKKCSFGKIGLTLKSVPNSLKLNKLYPFTLQPLSKTYAGLLKKINVKEDDYSSSLLQISCSYKDPYLCKKIVNMMISSYGAFLQKQAEQLAEIEMSYLEKKKEAGFLELQALLDKSICLQKEQLNTFSFFPVETKLDKIMQPFYESKEKVAKIGAKLKTLTDKPSQYLCEGFSQLNSLQKTLDELQGQKELLALSTPAEKVPSFFSYLGLSFPHCLTQKNTNEELKLLEGEINRLDKDSENLKQLSLKKKVLEQRSHYPSFDKSFEGIDLKTAKSLLVASYQKLDESQTKVQNTRQLIKQIDLEKSLASLSIYTKNPIFFEEIKKADKLAFALKSEDLTTKEKNRISQELICIKSSLKKSLEYEMELELLLQEKLLVKIAKLKTLEQDRLQQKIALGIQKKNELLASYQKELSWEKTFLESNLSDITDQMKSIPQQWKLEKELKIKTNMVTETIKSIGRALEERSFLAQVKKGQSKSVDKASLFFIQERPLLLFLSIAFAFFCTLIAFFILFYKRCFSGFPLSKELLKAYGKEVIGKGNLFETAEFIQKNLTEEKKVVTLLQHVEKYVKELLALFMKRGYKIIVVDGLGYLEKKGWIDHLENNRPLSVEKTKMGDFLFVGKKDSFLENISSLAFLKMIDTLKKEYNIIIVACDALPLSLEARATLTFSDGIVLPVEEETYEQIQPYLLWEEQGNKLGFKIGR